MRNVEDIIMALRCQNLPGDHCIGDGCPYYTTVAEDKIDSICRELGVDKSKMPAVSWNGCDIDKTVMDAIKALEETLEPKPRWIPVTERLPDMEETAAGSHYSEAVALLTDGRKVITGILSDQGWICDDEFWDAENEEITHWMSVLPLPELPKGGTEHE